MKPPQQKKRVKAKVWALVNGDTFIAALRFKPKRVHQGGDEGKGYYAWTDCNGPRYHTNKKDFPYATNVLEGSMNARLVPCTIEYSLPPKSKKRRAKTI